MRITINKQATKRLKSMQPTKARAIRSAIRRIAANPFDTYNNVTTMVGVPNGFRLRIGDWRILYLLDIDAGLMDVFKIEKRGDVYR